MGKSSLNLKTDLSKTAIKFYDGIDSPNETSLERKINKTPSRRRIKILDQKD
jgi:hypothetical protein